MKEFLLLLTFSLVFIHKSAAFSINQIDGIVGVVEKINFDSKGNFYVGTYNLTYNHLFYKFGSSKELLWTISLPDFVDEIVETHVTSENDIYFDFFNYMNLNHTVAILKSDSTTVEDIETFKNGLFLMDKNDNLFYNGGDGLHVLRRNSTVPILITNLENVVIFGEDDVAVDASGNVYFGVNNNLAVVTIESLQEEIPHATFTKLAEEDSQVVAGLTFNERNDLWILLSNLNPYEGTVKKLSNGTLETIFVDSDHPDNRMVVAKDKIFVIAGYVFDHGNSSGIYYFTLDNEVIEIPELSNLDFDFLTTYGTVDSDGNAYFHTIIEFSPTLGPMILIKPDETKPISIDFGFEGVRIRFFTLDFNEDVWIVTHYDGLFYLRKGEIAPEKVIFPDEAYCEIYNDVTVNWLTKEIYVTCWNGLFVLV